MNCSITAVAAEKAKELFSKKNLENAALRVFVVGGGCSGYQYGMQIVVHTEVDDIIVESNGVKLVVDPESAPLLDGAEIDWQDDLMKSGFTIFNPNATKSCACGTSFQTKEGGGKAKPCSH